MAGKGARVTITDGEGAAVAFFCIGVINLVVNYLYYFNLCMRRNHHDLKM